LFILEGYPEIVQSDNGLEFKNSIVKSFLEEHRISQKFGRPRHPQSQGQTERCNQSIIRRLSAILYQKEKRWIEEISKIYHFIMFAIVFIYNFILFLFLTFLEDATAYYNNIPHRATNQVPFCVFRNRRYHMNNQFDYENERENPEEVLSDPIQNSEDEVSNLLDDNFIEHLGENTTSETLSETVDLVLEKDHFPISSHYGKNYLNRMNKKAKIHVRKFKVGQKVYLKKDFDNNAKSRREKFETFFYPENYTVTDVADDGKINIQDSRGEQKVVSCALLKKK